MQRAAGRRRSLAVDRSAQPRWVRYTVLLGYSCIAGHGQVEGVWAGCRCGAGSGGCCAASCGCGSASGRATEIIATGC